MKTFDIKSVLVELAKKRPVFHSEADFQFALAWELQQMYPDASVRLEYNPQIFPTRTYIDIWMWLPDGSKVAIELKYKTKEMTLTYQEETYELARHGAPANNRFLVIEDIQRLEYVARHVPDTVGYAVLVTNDNEYWQEWKRPKDTKDKAFRVQEGAVLSGMLKWKEDTAKSTIDALGDSLYLSGEYVMNWTDYSTLSGTIFKLLVNQVGLFAAQAVETE